jgi:hypothetical protein
MSKRFWAGMISGLIYGAAIFWGAAGPAFSVGGLVALAAAAVGFMGAIGGGGLIGLIVAMGVKEETEEKAAKKDTVAEPPVEHRAAA